MEKLLRCYLLVILFVVFCIVTRPPQITSQFQTEYYITEDNQDSLVLKCEASGQSPITYEWWKDGDKIVPSTYSYSVIVDESRGYLSIVNAQIHEFGTYQCFAVNMLGTAAAAPFEVKRSFIREFTDKQPVEIKATAFKYGYISCTGKPKCEPYNDCMIEWKRGTGTTTTMKESKRVAVDAHGNLHFVYMEVGDESTSSVPISCGMNLEADKAFYKGRDVTLKVALVTNPNLFKPLPVFAKDVKGLLYGDARLQCIFGGYPVPDIDWYRPDGSIIIVDGYKYSYVDDQIRRDLIIKQLIQDDEGTYRCDAKSVAGYESANVFLNVTLVYKLILEKNVTFAKLSILAASSCISDQLRDKDNVYCCIAKPSFTSQNDRLDSKVVPIGQDAKFTCKLESLKEERRPTAPEWSKNGVRLQERQIGSYANQKYQMNKDRTELTVKNVTRIDTGSIMCESGNVIFDKNLKDKFVKTYAGATLRIIDPILVSAVKQRHIEINDPISFSMAFTATTDADVPELFYKWYFTSSDNITVLSEAELLMKPWVHFFSNKNNLTIIPENVIATSAKEKVKEVIGIYKVQIFHEYESVSIEFEVTTTIKFNDEDESRSFTGYPLWFIILVVAIVVVVVTFISTLLIHVYRKVSMKKKQTASERLAIGDLHIINRHCVEESVELLDVISNEETSQKKLLSNIETDRNSVSTKHYEEIQDILNDEAYTSTRLESCFATHRLHSVTSTHYEEILDILNDEESTPKKYVCEVTSPKSDSDKHYKIDVSNEGETIPNSSDMLRCNVVTIDTSKRIYEKINKTQVEMYTSPYTAISHEYETISKQYKQSDMLEANVETRNTSERSYERIGNTQIEVYTSPYAALSRECQTIPGQLQISGILKANMESSDA